MITRQNAFSGMLAAVAVVAICAAAQAGEITGKGYPIATSYYTPPKTTNTYTPKTTYQNNGYSELPPVQSYNPNTGETVQLAPLGASASANTPAVTSTPLEGTKAFEAQPLNFPDTQRRKRATDETGRREVSMPSIWPALFSVIAVCGLFCLVLYVLKKYVPGHRQLFNHPAVEVLGRTHLDQKRYVSLVRVGKRIVVVGVSPDEMRSLSEITDEEEITGILEVARPKTEAGLSIFQKLFKKNVLDNEAAEAREMANAKAEQLKEQLQALRSRVADIAPVPEPERKKELSRRGKQFDAVG